MPSRKVNLLTLCSRDTIHRYLLSVAMILCNKMDFSFGTNMAGFCRASQSLDSTYITYGAYIYRTWLIMEWLVFWRFHVRVGNGEHVNAVYCQVFM